MGHMGSALVRGLRAHTRARLIVSDSSRENARAAKKADILFIAVKPSVVRTVLTDIKMFTEGKLVVSLAAGVNISAMKKVLGRASLARIMPNIPVAYGEGVVGFYPGTISARDKNALQKILSGLGLVLQVKKERDLDAITLIAGCGPGIVSFLIAMLARRAKKLGIAAENADALAVQTFKGTLAYLEKSGSSAPDLVKSVATKGGVTEAILKEFARGGFEKTFARAIATGYKKIKNIRS